MENYLRLLPFVCIGLLPKGLQENVKYRYPKFGLKVENDLYFRDNLESDKMNLKMFLFPRLGQILNRLQFLWLEMQLS